MFVYIHYTWALIYESILPTVHVLSLSTINYKCGGDRPERYRRMAYYMSILNSTWPTCMKPVLCHSGKSAMSLYMSRSDL